MASLSPPGPRALKMCQFRTAVQDSVRPGLHRPQIFYFLRFPGGLGGTLERSVFLHRLLISWMSPSHPRGPTGHPCHYCSSVCRDRKWNCTDHVCDATCSAIGMAHYLTFDGLKYMFPGECQYVLVQVRVRERRGGYCLSLGGVGGAD